MTAFWLVTTSFSGERKSKTITSPRSGFSPVTRTLPSTEILAASRTALVSRIRTSDGFPAFCCAEAANKARHSSTIVETLMGFSVSGGFRHLGIPGRGARHESGAAAVTWGRLAACAAVGNRRYPVQTRQLADCQSAAAYQAAPQQRPLPSVRSPDLAPCFLPGSENGMIPSRTCGAGGSWGKREGCRSFNCRFFLPGDRKSVV